jgi:hypothetical protein
LVLLEQLGEAVERAPVSGGRRDDEAVVVLSGDRDGASCSRAVGCRVR